MVDRAEQGLIDEKWMAYALELAKKAQDLDEVPVGAVVIKAGAVVGEGWNQVISQSDPTAHAEVVALRDAAKRLNNYRIIGTTLYVTLEPCSMCAGALLHGRIQRLVYGASEPKNGAVSSQLNLFELHAFNHHVDVVGGVLAEQSGGLISSFFRNKRLAKKVGKNTLR
ncbi:MAG: tRNA adenosine(34) deaminase TadA [Gammaproteobacteria bacterium]|nr:tRNA adenosine(34) deaminase TadA [Gammaproteobacteria bacterium]